MAQVINTNMQSMNAQRNLTTSQMTLSTSLQRLSSGLRVNSAKDDAAGLAIAERMTSQIRGFNVAQRNASDAISLAQTAEGAIGRISEAMQRMRELAVQSKNGTNSVGDRDNLQLEFLELQKEVERIIDGTQFNGTNLLSGGTAFSFQVGAANAGTDSIAVTAVDLDPVDTAIGNNAGGPAVAINGVDAAAGITAATAAITAIDAQLVTVVNARASWGATQNRFESVVQNLQVSAENISAARGRIMDADFAIETANLTRASILQQAGTAMLAQANALPNNVLTLLRG